jgi:meso-butanediol dehydrogenase/(S,S)-butanediol dehydrogenase/diacetyl reductase
MTPSPRTILVTGAQGAIGSAVLDQAREQGYRTIGVDARPADGVLGCDITDEAAVNALFREAGQVTDVVHAAGIVGVGSVIDTSIEEVDRLIRVNLLGSFVVARAAALALPAGGTLTFLASQAWAHGAPGWAAYCASKAGVVRLVEALAKEIGPRGVRVNAVSPGTVESPMIDGVADLIARLEDRPRDDVLDSYRLGNPLRRMARPEDIAEACLFLASPAADYINGANLAVDGGDRPG